MTIRLVTIYASSGPDRMLIGIRPGPSPVESCTIYSSGDGSVEQAALERIGRTTIATRDHQWNRRRPVGALLMTLAVTTPSRNPLVWARGL